jgi:hypothetical protein
MIPADRLTMGAGFVAILVVAGRSSEPTSFADDPGAVVHEPIQVILRLFAAARATDLLEGDHILCERRGKPFF